MATYVVGDIQGCHAPLRRLLDKAAFSPDRDTLWCAGDLVNRGPQSLETLRFLKSLGTAVRSVLGNHDLHFLAAATKAWTSGKTQTMRSLLEAPDCGEFVEWMRAMPLAMLDTIVTNSGPEQFLLVHAGMAPGWNFEKTLACAREVETALQGPDYLQFLKTMYGDKPDTWHDGLEGMDRLRVITNVLTRIRFCTPEGRLELATKSDAATAPRGYRPWYEFQQAVPGRRILFGHWATLDGHTGMSDIHALDTGCVWGRNLTLMRLEDGARISVSCKDMKS